MNCVEYEGVEVERSATANGNDSQRQGLFVVPRPSGRQEGEVVRRTVEILDFQLARGLMPS